VPSKYSFHPKGGFYLKTTSEDTQTQTQGGGGGANESNAEEAVRVRRLKGPSGR
jgi:predicted cupin superfamily sugar epimerase